LGKINAFGFIKGIGFNDKSLFVQTNYDKKPMKVKLKIVGASIKGHEKRQNSRFETGRNVSRQI
jgi:hypothetical protein